MTETTATENLPAPLAPAARAALALKSQKTETDLRELVQSSADITAVLDADGRDQAHGIAMRLRTARTTIEKAGKTAREDATAFSKAVIAEEKRLIEIVTPEETRILALRDGWDAEQERIQAEKIAAERRRTEAHEAKLAAIARIPASMIGKPAAEVLTKHDELAQTVVGGEWEEFADQAEAAYNDAADQLQALYRDKLAAEEEAQRQREAQEAERQRIAAEQAALTIQREQQAEAAREMARQKAELDAAREAIEAAKREAEAERQREADAQAAIAAANAAEVKRQLDELANARAALEADKLAASEANQREHDHADALKENAERDAERLARDQEEAIDENALRKATELSEAQAAFDLAVAAAEVDTAAAADKLIATTAAHLQLPQYDAEPTDEQIVDAYQEAFGGTAEQAIERLARFAAQYQQEAA